MSNVILEHFSVSDRKAAVSTADMKSVHLSFAIEGMDTLDLNRIVAHQMNAMRHAVNTVDTTEGEADAPDVSVESAGDEDPKPAKKRRRSTKKAAADDTADAAGEEAEATDSDDADAEQPKPASRRRRRGSSGAADDDADAPKSDGKAAPKRRRSRAPSAKPSESDTAGDEGGDDEITDADLTQACSRAAAVVTPRVVNDVLGEFQAKEPKGVDQKHRAKFIKRLNSLIEKAE